MDEGKQASPQDLGAFVEGLARLVDRQRRNNIYANNFYFQPSVWDFKILLGQLEQVEQANKSEVAWHTALTIPWLQVKLVAYYLRINDAFHECIDGPIAIPRHLMPKEPEPPTGEFANDPKAIALYEAQKKIYAEMFC